jgi:hypothetical protein
MAPDASLKIIRPGKHVFPFRDYDRGNPLRFGKTLSETLRDSQRVPIVNKYDQSQKDAGYQFTLSDVHLN